MDPTLFEGEIVLVMRPPLARLLAAVGVAGLSLEQRGAVVVTPEPGSKGLLLGMGRRLIVKRVIGLPGETVAFRTGRLLVDGAELYEPWVADGYRGALNMPEQRVAAGLVFVTGDNRRPLASHDSRQYGPLPASGLRGLVVGQLRVPWGEGSLRSPFAPL